MNKEVDINKLKWVRIFDPVHIPKYLVEQVRDKDYTVEDFYKYQELNCIHKTEKGMQFNPFHHLYVLVNEDNITKGFLWFVVDALSKDIVIQTFSIDKEYWGKGRAVKKLDEFVKDIRKKAKLNKIYWITNYPKHSKRYGYKISKSILMEWDPKDDDSKASSMIDEQIGEEEVKDGKDADGRFYIRREYRSTQPTTTTISKWGYGTPAAAES